MNCTSAMMPEVAFRFVCVEQEMSSCHHVTHARAVPCVCVNVNVMVGCMPDGSRNIPPTATTNLAIRLAGLSTVLQYITVHHCQ